MNKKPVQPVQDRGRSTQKEKVGDTGCIHHITIPCNARGDSALAKASVWVHFNSVTAFVGSKSGLGACVLIQLPAEVRTLKRHRPEDQSDKRLDQRAATLLPVSWMYLRCSKALSSSRNTPTTFADYLQQQFILHQKHHSKTICVWPTILVLCFAFAVKNKSLCGFFFF